MIARVLACLLIGLIALFLAACSVTTTAIGYDLNNQERFSGNLTMSLVDGTGRVHIKGERSGVTADGVALYQYGAGSNRGGTVRIQASDGRLISGEWISRSTSSGVGSGRDDRGNEYVFAFGFGEAETQVFFEEQEARSKRAASGNRGSVAPSAVAGTGFAVGTGDMILTNEHLVRNAHTVVVFLVDGTRAPAHIVAVNSDDDLALLRIERVLPSLSFASDEDLARGAAVAAVGFPLTTIQGTEAKATFGNINALSGIGGDPRFLQVDCALQPGNSGGPLLLDDGRVAGVIAHKLSAIATLRATGTLPENVAYAIKPSRALHFLRSHVELAGDQAPGKRMSNPDLVRFIENSTVRVCVEEQ